MQQGLNLDGTWKVPIFMDPLLAEPMKRHKKSRRVLANRKWANQLSCEFCELLIGNIYVSCDISLKNVTTTLSWLYALKSIFTSSVLQVVTTDDLIHRWSLQLCCKSDEQMGFGVLERLYNLSKLMNFVVCGSKR